MKNLLLLFTFCFSVSAWAVEHGTYAWVGVGCRDSSLSEESHVTKVMSANPEGVSFARFNINSDGTASMYAVINDETQRFSSDEYSETEDTIEISIEGGGIFLLHIVGDTLIIVEEDEDSAEETCGSNKKYVYVLEKVN